MEKNEIILAVFMLTLLAILIAGFLLFIFIWYRKKRNNYLQEKAFAEISYKKELLQTQLEIQEQTFKIISEEIHDNIGQTLSFVKLNLSTIKTDDNIISAKITESNELLNKTIHDLRDLSRSLNPGFISDIGLANAIKQQLQLLEKTGRYTVVFTAEGTEYKNDPQRELVVFRVIQELLNNIVKHAVASVITTTIQYQPEQLVISVKDNGNGFDIENKSAAAHKSLGLRNMYNRMKLVNGSMQITSARGSGTTAIIRLAKDSFSLLKK
ncbi:sensor histidine kinase [Panacibacter ginsenosidivorans]|uniref:histidine kinase n=1 Tax=Panacibacter ginsenosidivorans TaxID=1813871 RepID=A0A5B8V8Q4_9BACT|nr:ATP-binding protein [Panacibacter ginsenosidivorans]QEC67877.1 sensor histidine kinase [Panacibacter ginsenosidivorans]